MSSFIKMNEMMKKNHPFDTLINDLGKSHFVEKDLFSQFEKLGTNGMVLDEGHLKRLINQCTEQLRGFKIIDHIVNNIVKNNSKFNLDDETILSLKTNITKSIAAHRNREGGLTASDVAFEKQISSDFYSNLDILVEKVHKKAEIAAQAARQATPADASAANPPTSSPKGHL